MIQISYFIYVLILFSFSKESSILSLNCLQVGYQDRSSDLQKLIKTSKDNKYRNLKLKPSDYDGRIYKILTEEESSIEHIDASFFLECFLNGLNDTILYILDNHEAIARKFFAEKYSEYDSIKSFKTLKIL